MDARGQEGDGRRKPPECHEGVAGAALRNKTPDLVLQEIDGLMLAHCAVRSLIHRAVGKAREDPDGISFVHAVRVVRRRLQNPGAVSP